MHWREIPGSRSERPVSVAELKEYIGLPEAYSSPLLETILDGAIAAVERHAGYATTQCQIEVWYDSVPTGQAAIPQPPLVSVDEAALVNVVTGEEQALQPSDYTVTSNGRVSFITLNKTPATPQRLRLRCTVGYASAGMVPAELKLAILRTALRCWEQKSVAVVPDLEPLVDAKLWQTWQTL
jgi:uncharacterized phiE125 gp8 family phage protein